MQLTGVEKSVAQRRANGVPVAVSRKASWYHGWATDDILPKSRIQTNGLSQGVYIAIPDLQKIMRCSA